MKLISVLVMALLLAVIGSAQNYMPEFTMEPGGNLTFSGGNLYLAGGDIDSWVGNNREELANYDLIIKSIGTDLYGIHANGTILSTGTTSNCGAVWNEAVDAMRSGSVGKMTVFVDAATLTTTETMYLYSYMRVLGTGGGLPAVYVASDIPIFKCNDTGGSGNNPEILLQDLYLEYTGTDLYTSGHVELWSPNQCTVIRVTTRTPNIIGGGNTNRGGIRLLSTATPGTVYSWLNRVIDCPCTGIEFENVSDSWIIRNDIYNGLHGNYSVRIGNNSNSLKIMDNHIIAQNDSGIAFLASNENTIISGNYFEPIMAVSAGLTEHGIYFDSAGTYRFIDISNNVMRGLGGVGIYAQNVRDSVISENKLENLNRNYNNDTGYIMLSAVTENKCWSNVVQGNIMRDDWNEASTNYGIMEVDGTYDPNYNRIVDNIIRGGAFDSPGVVVVGANTITNNTISYVWDP